MTLETLPKVDIPTISVNDLKGMLDRGEDFTLLDIRLHVDSQKYWVEAPARLNVTLDELTEQFAQISKQKKLVVLDKNGKRSGLAARYLGTKGFDEIVLVSGGMNEWIKAGLPTKMAK